MRRTQNDRDAQGSHVAKTTSSALESTIETSSPMSPRLELPQNSP